ncbi:hypothetical protein, partial [Streptomyces roseolus]|uniref:hypothetical protein n=1 Tax=Streptomyces roseolus TaxID=67358 RepID=UPI003645F553
MLRALPWWSVGGTAGASAAAGGAVTAAPAGRPDGGARGAAALIGAGAVVEPDRPQCSVTRE